SGPGVNGGSSGALAAGNTITAAFPGAFTVPATPVISNLTGTTNCSATASTLGSTVTVTLADSGGTCAVAAGAAVTFRVSGITNPSAQTFTNTLFSVATSADLASSPAANVTIGA